MISPRWGGAGPHQRKNTLAWVVALAAVLTAAPCGAQSAGALATDPDSAPAARPDSAATGRTAIDSAATDTSALDSAATPRRPASPPPAPVDSTLGAACVERPGGQPDLLLVTFRPSTTASERSAVAEEIGGTLLGMSQHAAPGSWYLRVPGSAGDRSVADRLILMSPVLEVGTTRCPA